MRALPSSGTTFIFGPFTLIPIKQSLLKDGRPVRLGGRALDILYLLVSRAGQEVTKSELIAFAWPNVCVDEQNLKVNISGLRRALHDSQPEATYIATVVGRGYQFVAPVQVGSIGATTSNQLDKPVQRELPIAVPLVGRQRDVDRVCEALKPGALVSLVGAGGVGKTSLALACANAEGADFPDGTCFVDLCTTDDPALIAHIVATALGAKAEAIDLSESVVNFLRARRMLVVLDNCEHVLHAVAALAARLVDAKTGSCLLVTSRDPLGVAAEDLHHIEPLACPDSAGLRNPSDALTYSSVELFVHRAVETTDYNWVDGDLPVIARICVALDGLPLAIEIAASALSTMSPTELLENVGPRIGATPHHADVHSRHRTLWATLEWSYRLLSVDEAAMFRLLSVFTGLFDWTDVLGMAAVLELDKFRTNVALGGLVAKSLLTAECSTDQLRYRFLESARHFASKKLRGDRTSKEAQRCHARLVLSAMQKSEQEWVWVERHTWHARYDARAGDVRKALDWSFGEDGDAAVGIDLTAATNRLWTEQSSIFENLYQIERALAHESLIEDAPKKKATLAISRAWNMTIARRPSVEAGNAWDAALQLAEVSEDANLQLVARFGKAVFLIYLGDNAGALRVTKEAEQLALREKSQGGRIDAERLEALAEMHLGNLVEARAKLERLALELESGVPPSTINRYRDQRYVGLYSTLAFCRWLTGDTDGAALMVEEMLQVTAGVRPLMAQTNLLSLVGLPLAMLDGRADTLERYAIYLGENLQREKMAFWAPVHRFYDSWVSHMKGDLKAVDEMASAVNSLVEDGFLARTSMYMSAVAQALLSNGRHDEADETAESAFKLAKQASEPWCLPELCRVKALILTAKGHVDAARSMFDEGQRIAIASGARAFDLRIAAARLKMANRGALA